MCIYLHAALITRHVIDFVRFHCSHSQHAAAFNTTTHPHRCSISHALPATATGTATAEAATPTAAAAGAAAGGRAARPWFG